MKKPSIYHAALQEITKKKTSQQGKANERKRLMHHHQQLPIPISSCLLEWAERTGRARSGEQKRNKRPSWPSGKFENVEYKA